jgi:hypothetical protein
MEFLAAFIAMLLVLLFVFAVVIGVICVFLWNWFIGLLLFIVLVALLMAAYIQNNRL